MKDNRCDSVFLPAWFPTEITIYVLIININGRMVKLLYSNSRPWISRVNLALIKERISFPHIIYGSKIPQFNVFALNQRWYFYENRFLPIFGYDHESGMTEGYSVEHVMRAEGWAWLIDYQIWTDSLNWISVSSRNFRARHYDFWADS